MLRPVRRARLRSGDWIGVDWSGMPCDGVGEAAGISRLMSSLNGLLGEKFLHGISMSKLLQAWIAL